MVVTMVTHRQVRAARMLLEWTQQTLADRAIVGLSTVQRIESDKNVEVDSLKKVLGALRAAGIEFLSDGEGVKFANTRAKRL